MSTITRGAGLVAVVTALAVGLWLGFGPSEEEPYPHEYAPIEAVNLSEALAGEEKILRHTRELRDFSGLSLDGRTVDAQALVEEHPVVLFTYVAEWCENCRYEAPHLARLYWKYADRGFRIVARSEYSHPQVMREVAGMFGSPYPIIQGSPNPDPENEDAVRTTTHHFRLRKALGDPRKWGTPMNLLVLDGNVDRMHMVLGEFVPEELDRFLDENLPPRQGSGLQAAGDRGTGASMMSGGGETTATPRGASSPPQVADPTASPATTPAATRQETRNERVVLEFFEAWERLDPEELAGYFTEDGVYHNIPTQPVQGRQNIESLIRGFIADWTETHWEVRTLMSDGNVVVAERIDHVTAGDASLDLPVVGVFEMEDGRIAEWRDYFDLATYQQGLQ
ncbi:MAG: SgcJ/EcaC family oxidoreductase [Longimicrobiales bacterium]|nr:SgcJ/EcaC family oxidoreductase [Longimicrobiales bacterium]